MDKVIAIWNEHGTKILGTLAGIVAGLITVPNLIPSEHVPYWSAANIVLGVMTVNRGFTNSKRADQ